jgi:hypothetical protein
VEAKAVPGVHGRLITGRSSQKPFGNIQAACKRMIRSGMSRVKLDRRRLCENRAQHQM